MPENKENVAPSLSPAERPDLQGYRSTDKVSANTNTCQDCGKVFPSTEELTAHYKKDHPESFQLTSLVAWIDAHNFMPDLKLHEIVTSLSHTTQQASFI